VQTVEEELVATEQLRPVVPVVLLAQLRQTSEVLGMQEVLLDLILQMVMFRILTQKEMCLLLVVPVQMVLQVQTVGLQQERLLEVLVLLEV
jgi:hypothetical protein